LKRAGLHAGGQAIGRFAESVKFLVGHGKAVVDSRRTDIKKKSGYADITHADNFLYSSPRNVIGRVVRRGGS
jgi:hypothetical protein